MDTNYLETLIRSEDSNETHMYNDMYSNMTLL